MDEVMSGALPDVHDASKNITVEGLGGGATSFVEYDLEAEVASRIGQPGFVTPQKIQDDSFACGGFTTASHAEKHRALSTGVFVQDSPKYVIAQTFVLDAQGNMIGSRMKDNLAIASIQGVSTEALCRSVDAQGNVTDKFLNRPQDISLQARLDALAHKGNGYAYVEHITIESVSQALKTMKGAQMLIRGQNGKGWTSEAPQVTTEPQWGHFMDIVKSAIIDGEPFIWAKQTLPGSPRLQRFGRAWFDSGFIEQVGTLVPPAITLPKSYKFTRNLTVGSQGVDVKILQKYLNDRGYIVAVSGPGSPGQETNFFGPKTRDAVARFQAAKNIHPAVGYFGPLSRSLVNSSP